MLFTFYLLSFCWLAYKCVFQRSRSEILMSQSPPSTFSQGAELGGEGRSHTLPRGAGARRSLTLPPPAPPLSKVKFASSPSDMYKMDEIDGPPIQYLIAVHRWVAERLWFLMCKKNLPFLLLINKVHWINLNLSIVTIILRQNSE